MGHEQSRGVAEASFVRRHSVNVLTSSTRGEHTEVRTTRLVGCFGRGKLTEAPFIYSVGQILLTQTLVDVSPNARIVVDVVVLFI